jgi:DNA-binding NarL/FixJ family response regulator
MDKIRVFLLGDFVLLRSGLRALLADSANVEVIGESALEDDTAARVQDLQPSVVVFAVSKDEDDVFKTVKDLGALATHIVAVSPNHDSDFVLSLLRAGVHGYLSNHEAPAELVRALDAVARGEVFLCPSASKALLAEYRCQSGMK